MKNINTKNEGLKKFGGRIREKRILLGMTIEELAEKANRSDREVRAIERGKVEPLLGTALLLCYACDIEIGELKEFIPQEEPAYA